MSREFSLYKSNRHALIRKPPKRLTTQTLQLRYSCRFFV